MTAIVVAVLIVGLVAAVWAVGRAAERSLDQTLKGRR